MERIDQDKLTERYTVAIPGRLKVMVDLLRLEHPDAVERLNQRLRYQIARVVHEQLMFDPDLYLTSSGDPVQSLLGKLIGRKVSNGKPTQFEDDTP